MKVKRLRILLLSLFGLIAFQGFSQVDYMEEKVLIPRKYIILLFS